MKNRNLHVSERIGDDQYLLNNGTLITTDQDFIIETCACDFTTHAIMLASAHDADGKKYELTVHDDRLNSASEDFELDMISYDKPEVFAL